MVILGIETSCDESAVALLDVNRGKIRRFEHLVASQAIHAKYGGVVPEVAAREHSSTLPLLLAALAEKVVGKANGRLLGKSVDVIAATRGPGLVTSLRVGLDTARGLAAAWGRKLVGVNHIEGHIYANWIGQTRLEPAVGEHGIFPALALVVSGGHTELLLMKNHGSYRLLGATCDDAAGEAFDKTAKLLGLGYPGGPEISRLALEGNASAFDFPRPLLGTKDHDFSFAGLKTAVRYFLRKNEDRLADQRFVRDVCASFEQAVVDVLVAKTVAAAARQMRVKCVLLAGGVAANGKLRASLAAAVGESLPGVALMQPPLAYCADNAAMIAAAGYFRAQRRKYDDYRTIEVDAQWEIGRKKL